MKERAGCGGCSGFVGCKRRRKWGQDWKSEGAGDGEGCVGKMRSAEKVCVGGKNQRGGRRLVFLREEDYGKN